MIKNVLLTYDINIKQTEVKNAMKEKEYFEEKYSNKSHKTYTLPNTTLWKQANELTTVTVLNDLNKVIEEINRGLAPKDKIILEKAIAVEFTNWSAIEN